jgi:hypothetical protein
MALSDDFAKVQLQAAAATKDLSLDPRLGACRAEPTRRARSPASDRRGATRGIALRRRSSTPALV